MISRDTSRESDRLLTELYRAMTPAEKSLSPASNNASPTTPPQQLWRRWARQHLGDVLYEKVYRTTSDYSLYKPQR
jgi:uncharacterized lipoprotein YddW (UPF0748 family)